MDAKIASDGSPTTGTVLRATMLLTRLSEADGPVSIAELAEQVRLPTSTVHRLLNLLRESGFAEQVPKSRSYRPGPEWLRLAGLVMRGRRVGTLARPIMERVVDRCNETCVLAIYLPSARAITFAEQVESSHPLRFDIPCDVQRPVVWGSSGRVILAHMDEQEVARIVEESEPSPVTGARIDDVDAFLAQLGEIRERGYDLTRGEKLADSVGVAAPIFQGEQGVVGSLTVTLPVVRYEEDDRDTLAELIVGAASELSAMLGHRPAVLG